MPDIWTLHTENYSLSTEIRYEKAKWKWLLLLFLSDIGTWAIKAHSSKHLSSSRDRLTALHGVSYRGWGRSTFSKLVFLFFMQLRIQKQVLECTSEDILVPSSCAIGTFEFVNPTCISWKPTMCMTECKVLVRISINRCWVNKWKLLKEQEIISSASRSLLCRRTGDCNLKHMADIAQSNKWLLADAWGEKGRLRGKNWH